MKFLIIFLLSFNYLSAQEYSFDFEEFEKKPYEYIGNLQIQPDFMLLNKASKLYAFSFQNKEEKDYWDSYNASLQLKGSYEISKFKFSLDIKDQLSFTKNDELENNFSIYEFFGNANLSTNFSMQIGEKSVKWGKGYIWNPVSFVGRQKDINDVDAGSEGFWMMKLDYVKSLSGLLQNYSITPVFIPVTEDINKDFQLMNSFNFILNSYFLIKDTDIDFYLFIQEKNFEKLGFDFARNILPNWEIHAEYVYEKDVIINSWNSDYEVEQFKMESNNYLFGSRMLFPTNITVIFEYLHNDVGLDTEQMTIFFEAAKLATSGNPTLLPIIKEYQMESFSGQFLMKDYLYLKLSQPEPFDILYFTSSVYFLHNMNDNSEMIGGELNYSRFEDLNMKLKYNLMFGEENSEFGEKISSDKISFLMEYVF